MIEEFFTNAMVQTAIARLDAIPDFLKLVLLSVIPCFGLRGGMIGAYLLDVRLMIAIPACIIGNFIPVPFIFVFVRYIMFRLKKVKCFEKLIEGIEKKALSKSHIIDKYGALGIWLFVALPLPGTGAYSGTLIASLLNMPVKKTAAAVLCGMITSAAVMTLLVILIR